MEPARPVAREASSAKFAWAAALGVLANVPLFVACVDGMTDTSKLVDQLFLFALALGPSAVLVTASRMALHRERPVALFLVVLALAGVEAFFMAGFMALGGGGRFIGWFLLGFLLTIASGATALIAADRRRRAR